MAELVTKEQVIDWFRCYGHMDKPIPYDVLVTDIQVMDTVDAATEQQWIPLTERFPEKAETVIIYTDTNLIYAGELIGDIWFLDNDSWTETVTHWMPLPEPPREVPEK